MKRGKHKGGENKTKKEEETKQVDQKEEELKELRRQIVQLSKEKTKQEAQNVRRSYLEKRGKRSTLESL